MKNVSQSNEIPTTPTEIMDEVVHYLELKNMYYERFLATTQKFKKQAVEQRWSGMELLVDNRERILSIIKHFNLKIGALLESLSIETPEVEPYRDQVRYLHEKRVKLANQIVVTDLELISLIDEMKTETIRELKQTQDTQQQIHSFGTRPPNKHESEA